MRSISIQKQLVAFTIIQFIVKIVAWYFTHSVSILTDALESIINIIGSIVGFFALYIALKPKDRNHPYGHGKIEFLSAAFEGFLIGSAGLIIIYDAIINLKVANEVHALDIGIIIVFISAALNFLYAYKIIEEGKTLNSVQLISSGEHLKTDGLSTLGVLLGLVIMYFTKWYYLDSIIAIIFSVFLIITSFKIIKNSLSGILDETDEELLDEVVTLLEKARNDNWIDLHNLRIIKFGSKLHFDCHLTVPYYLNVNEAHEEVKKLEKIVTDEYREAVEMFVHTDGCEHFSCKICSLQNCKVRQHEFVQKITWSKEVVLENNKHKI